MVDAPEQFFEELADAGLDVVSFHHEAVGDPEPAIAKARAAGLRVGITLNMETPVEAVFPVLDQVDDVMLMSIRPGWSGQTLESRGLPASGRDPHRDRPAGACPSTWRSTAASRSTTPGRPSTPGATVLIAASGIFQADEPVAAAAELASIARGEAA